MQAMKYRINPRKLGKAPLAVLPILFAHFEYDDASPYFDAIRPYLDPSTPEERWDELVSVVRMKYEELGQKIERKFRDQSARSNRRFEQIKSQLSVAP